MSRTTATVLAAFLILTGWVTLEAQQRPAGAQEVCDGVWVVVDARAIGGALGTRCASGDPTNGVTALQQAGFASTFVPNQPGFICTIDRRPDPCNMAPADAYWSYWHAPVGGSWTYANVGAAQRDPAPGTVEGWRFGDGSAPPGVAPPATPAPRSPAPSSDAGGTAPTGGSDDDRGEGPGSDGDADTSTDGTGSADGADSPGGGSGGSDSGGTDDGTPDDGRLDDGPDSEERDTAGSDASATGDDGELAGSGTTRDDPDDELGSTSDTDDSTDDADGSDAAAPRDGDAAADGTAAPDDTLALRDASTEGGVPGVALVLVLLGALGGVAWWQRHARMTT